MGLLGPPAHELLITDMLCAVALRPASMRWTGVAGGNGAELDPKMAVNSSQNDQAGTPTALHIQLRPRRDRPLSMHDEPVAQRQ